VDPLVNKRLKGLYNKSPPSARYSQTWNPDTVLSYFDATAGAALSLLELYRKLVTLLALCTLLRTCELFSISLESIVVSDSEMSFSLSKPRKAQHSGPLHRVSVAAWRLNVSICPVKAWKLIYTILQHCAMPQLFPSYAQQQQTPWSGLCSYNWPLDKGATQNNRY
jgi:hypothetical protein